MHYSDAFDGTAATVIPVLLLALSLQGDFLLRTFLAGFRLSDEAMQDSPKYEEWIRTPFVRAMILSFIELVSPLVDRAAAWTVNYKAITGALFVLVALGVTVLGVMGEIVSVVCLAGQGSTPGWQAFLVAVVIVLASCVGIAFLDRQIRELMTMAKEQALNEQRSHRHTTNGR